jgi:hypothetical protein
MGREDVWVGFRVVMEEEEDHFVLGTGGRVTDDDKDDVGSVLVEVQSGISSCALPFSHISSNPPILLRPGEAMDKNNVPDSLTRKTYTHFRSHSLVIPDPVSDPDSNHSLSSPSPQSSSH